MTILPIGGSHTPHITLRLTTHSPCSIHVISPPSLSPIRASLGESTTHILHHNHRLPSTPLHTALIIYLVTLLGRHCITCVVQNLSVTFVEYASPPVSSAKLSLTPLDTILPQPPNLPTCQPASQPASPTEAISRGGCDIGLRLRHALPPCSALSFSLFFFGRLSSRCHSHGPHDWEFVVGHPGLLGAGHIRLPT